MRPETRRMLRFASAALSVYFAFATAFSLAAGQQPVPPSSFPRLVVLLVVDQMRADYIERFKRDWTGGFRRLLNEGAWFSHTEYPYLFTVTCAGHATIASGSFPHTHGVIAN